ncbi:hypothetical protein EUTSA_v10009632mg [Eutrema salsugineum]|uniref:Phytocyanin domain-containing protein n=1 Tax=Eutrema salsugineum TaxID=72664 RepID=V4KUP5_EUTSA|nr:basic blue protein [Eutrema salsugineum]ESQ35019.1 hypothetical protein EUTSA_v10009632mg [Eutrema salsugineum]
MARSSVTATVPIGTIITVLGLFLAGGFTHARSPTTYTVGDQYGWGLRNSGDIWARGKTFYAGDFLVFKYNNSRFNLMLVNQTGYDMCTPNDGALEFKSGEDKINLPYGGSYFIGTRNPTDCFSGMKLQVNGLAPY